MLRISPALPVAPSILHSRQTRVLLAIQEMRRQGRKATSLKSHRKSEDDCSSTLSCRHSLNDIEFTKRK
jgi:hypothetical protein